MSMACWYPNGTLTEPDITTDWMGYPNHFGCDYINFDLNRAVADGVVIYAGYNPSGAGNEVRVRHETGEVTRYLHNASIRVVVGQTVKRGDVLGVQGSTGDATGKHLHFEARTPQYIAVPPRPWLRAHLASTAGGGSGTSIPASPDPVEAARLERIRRAKDMSYLCTPTTDWKARPLIAGTKTPVSIVWNGPTSTLIDTQAKLTAAQRFHRTDEDRKVVSEADWAWLVSLLPGPAGDVDEAALAKELAPLLGSGASQADLAAAVASIKAAIPTIFKAG